MNELLAKISARHVKPKFTEVKVGDTVRVYTRIKEGEKERTQYFEGLVIRRRGGIGPNASFSVRRIASGIGVERTFPLHSPLIERVQIQRGAKVRRATLYTMRGLTGKAARLTELPVKQADRETEHPWLAKFGVTPAPEPAADEANTDKKAEAPVTDPEPSAKESAKPSETKNEAKAATKEPPAKESPAKPKAESETSPQAKPNADQVDAKNATDAKKAQ